MRIKNLEIKNFRCFSKLELNFEKQVTIISGLNGTGKTSILEAIHYIGYMRSFRTHLHNNLVKFDSDNFFVKVAFESNDSLQNEIQAGFSQNKRLVKLNRKSINSFKDLMDFYRIVTLVEDDLRLIKGGPEIRRSFLDQAILLCNHNFLKYAREFKKVLYQRNMLLKSEKMTTDLYDLWTAQLWEKTINIQNIRNNLVKDYEKMVNNFLREVFEESITVSFEYKPQKMILGADFSAFLTNIDSLKSQEMRFSRSLFGAHLDDFSIGFCSKSSKFYSSRGQQKLVVLLLKVAQLLHLAESRGQAVFLLDDFMSDFDEKKASSLAKFLLSLDIQLIFTSPSQSGYFDDLMLKEGAFRIQLPH